MLLYSVIKKILIYNILYRSFALAYREFEFESLNGRDQDNSFIIQITPDLSIEGFLKIYPSLIHQLSGQIQFGNFSLIYGRFNSRLVKYLYFSSLVVDIDYDFTVKIFDVQTNAPRHLGRLSQKEKLPIRGK